MRNKHQFGTRKWIMLELETEPYRELLTNLQTRTPHFQNFATWRDIIEFLKNPATDFAARDAVLNQLLREYQSGLDARWPSVFMALFFPGLGRLCRRRNGWEVDVDELWHVITVVFIDVLRRIDPALRTERIAQKLMNDTAHHLHDEYRRRWRRSATEAPVEPETLTALLEERQEECSSDASSGTLARFDEQIRLGVIGKSDGELILQTRAQGVGLREFSQRSGISVQALKKRRQRAEARLRQNWFNE